jgi:hypothetical protein
LPVLRVVERHNMSELEEQFPGNHRVDASRGDGPLLSPTEQHGDGPPARRLSAEQLRAAANVLAHVHAQLNSAIALPARES